MPDINTLVTLDSSAIIRDPQREDYNISNGNMTVDTGGPSSTGLQVGATFMFLALFIGLVGNAVVLVILLQQKGKKNIINVFIMSLCINDILNLSLNNVTVLLSYISQKNITNLIMCEMVMHLGIILMGSSLWHTGLIAVHRLIVVVFNQRYKTMSKKAYTIFVLVFARVVPFAFLMHPYIGKMAYYEPKLLRCVVKKEFGLFTMFISVVLMILPSFILIVCYIVIFIKVHASSARMRSNSKNWLKREIQITKMFGIVFLVIMIGYIPYGITRSIDKQMKLSADFYVAITVFFAAANSANPLVYGAMDASLRRSCLDCVHWKDQSFLCFKGEDEVDNDADTPTTVECEPLNNGKTVETETTHIVPPAIAESKRFEVIDN